VGVLAKEEGPNNQGVIRYGGVTLERNGRASIRTEYEEGVFVSAYQVMPRRLNIPTTKLGKGPSDSELAEFLRGIDRRQRRLLKQIAEAE